MNRTLILVAATAAAALSSVSAYAGCADPRTQGAFRQMPPISLPLSSGINRVRSGDATTNIVGTWLVTYTVEDNPFGQAYIQWHSDRTEWENINLPLSGGNICVGSWTTVDSRHVSRNHWGWLYNNGELSGYFNETETDKVSNHGMVRRLNTCFRNATAMRVERRAATSCL